MFGMVTGSPVSVTFANLVMEDVEERALATTGIVPKFWKRYVDDTCWHYQLASVKLSILILGGTLYPVHPGKRVRWKTSLPGFISRKVPGWIHFDVSAQEVNPYKQIFGLRFSSSLDSDDCCCPHTTA